MAEIIYFGTNGCSGHYPIGIDKKLTGAEYEIWRECDNETWINNIRKNPGRHLIKHHGEVYTNYGVPFSVDDERGGSHTELFWKGIHTKEEIVNLIKNNQFLARQFKMDDAIYFMLWNPSERSCSNCQFQNSRQLCGEEYCGQKYWRPKLEE